MWKPRNLSSEGSHLREETLSKVVFHVSVCKDDVGTSDVTGMPVVTNVARAVRPRGHIGVSNIHHPISRLRKYKTRAVGEYDRLRRRGGNADFRAVPRTAIRPSPEPDKIYLANTNYFYGLNMSGEEPGTIRETFFISQVSIGHELKLPSTGYFTVNGNYVFEIGGKNKSNQQIKDLKNAWLVLDDI